MWDFQDTRQNEQGHGRCPWCCDFSPAEIGPLQFSLQEPHQKVVLVVDMLPSQLRQEPLGVPASAPLD